MMRSVFLGVALLAASAAVGAEPTTRAALLDEWRRVQEINYEALELAPVRHWGHDGLQEPLRRIRRQLEAGKRTGVADPRHQADAAYDQILRALQIDTIATISVGVNGEIEVDPQQPEVVLFRDVPAAVVFRVTPSPRNGKLHIAAPASGEVRIGDQVAELTRDFGTFVAFPIVANGSVGDRTVRLDVVAEGAKATVPLRIDVRASGVLKGRVVRQSNGAPLAAKLFVEDSRGRLYVAPGETNYRTQPWYAFFQPRFSYVEGDFEIPLPPGEYRLTSMKGYGYANCEKTVNVTAGQTAESRIEMHEIRPLEKEGWYCADMHIHGRTPLAMLRAEDVNVAAHCHYSSHKPLRLSVSDDESDATHLSCGAQEIEHWNFGNAFYFGIPTTVQDPPTPDPKMTPFFFYDEQAHRMGGITLRWLRGRPFSPRGGGQQQPEIAVDAALGYMDVWSVLDNSMQNALDRPRGKWTGDGWEGSPFYERTYKTWYALLNCGVRITASGGTSYGRLSRLGFNRVYAKCPEGLTVKSFAAALKRGDGFVTNGPMLWLRANGRLPGEVVALDAPASVTLSIELCSRHPVDTIEILRNGRVVEQRKLERFVERTELQTTMRVENPCWFAARCFGTFEPRYPHSAARHQFAHTNPLFVTVDGEMPKSAEDAKRFIEEIDALIEFAPNIPEGIRARSLEVFQKARRFYAQMVK